ncbi:MAG TPA: hypothetical protein VIB39_23580 [Candidatus Angelobacter sp.]
MNELEKFRASVLASFGAKEGDLAELLEYNRNHFDLDHACDQHFPLPDELFVTAWDNYAREVQEAGSIVVLAKYLVQLQFPIQAGVSESPAYVASTRQGALPTDLNKPLQWRDPERCRVVIHSTAAGRIPLLIAGHREDFVSLVRALTRRNEPAPIPESMGACMVAGYNNWHRIGLLRQQFEASSPDVSWVEDFQRIKTKPELYQDRFIILSSGPYSGVKAADLDLDEEIWRSYSLAIRREHECAHYYARRVFSSMRNNLLDELIADYFGISAAVGAFRADWLLRFMGLESFPSYREGGRLQNYRGKPPLSDDSFLILQRLVRDAALHLQSFDEQCSLQSRHLSLQPALYATLAAMTLEEMASEDGTALLVGRFNVTQQKMSGAFDHAAAHAGPDYGDSRSRDRRTETAAV